MAVFRNIRSRYRILPKQMPVLLGGSNLTAFEKIHVGLGPTAYWPLKETSGAVVNDLSGNGFNGGYSGATLAQMAAPGGGLAPLFDGVNDYCDTTSVGLRAVLPHEEGSLSAWYKVLDAGVWSDGQYRYLFSFGQDTNNRVGMFKSNSAGIVYAVYNGNGVQKLSARTGMSSTDWIHFAMTYSVAGNAMKFYVNNVVGATQTGIQAWIGATANVNIGREPTAPGSYSKGYIAHAAIYPYALSAEQVGAIYNGGI